jgi:hypothetical protein
MLSAEDVEAVARRTVELLRGDRPTVFALVDARQLAALLGVSVDYVYGHTTQLGAVRLGSGRRARIRFDVDVARRALDESRSWPAGTAAEKWRPRPLDSPQLRRGSVATLLDQHMEVTRMHVQPTTHSAGS